MSALEENYQKIIQTARNATVIAVSKMQPVTVIEELYHLGHRDFGESYVQELVTKAESLQRRGISDIRWHFIGHLQTNKVKLLLPHVSMLHTIDSERLALEVARRWADLKRPVALPVFLEVNIDGEKSKAGLAPSAIKPLIEKVRTLPALKLVGLMCIPAFARADEQTRDAFRALKMLAREHITPDSWLSMGMSDDYEIALAEGATHIRVGTALFGERTKNNLKE